MTNAKKAIAPALSCAILAIALVIHATIGTRSFINSPEKRDDFNRYYAIASAPGRPYVDYQVEHPIGTLLVFKLLAGLGGRATFGYGVVALNALGDALIVAALILLRIPLLGTSTADSFGGGTAVGTLTLLLIVGVGLALGAGRLRHGRPRDSA